MNQYLQKEFSSRDAWKTWINSGIRAQEAAVIEGKNPWKTATALLEERLHPKPFTPTPAMLQATELKPKALQAYLDISKTKDRLFKQNIESRTCSFMKADIDGISSNGVHVVILKPGAVAYKDARHEKGLPEYIYPEAQHILAITGSKYLTVCFYQENQTPILKKCYRNEAYIEILKKNEKAFLEKVQKASV
jgi:putative phage-type endonuclease